MEISHSFEKANIEKNANYLNPTPVNDALKFKTNGFTSLVEALDYAAEGKSGINFYSHRGELETVLTYRELRARAMELASRLQGLGCKRGDRVGIVAETSPMFHHFFFASLYAGLVPVALPAGVQLGARKAYVNQVRRMLEGCGATIAVAGSAHAPFLAEASESLDLLMAGTPEDFDALPASDQALDRPAGDDIAYLQYTSGSTRFPRGVEINHATALENIRQIASHGLKMTREDRFVSWLPYYHDMGLIGFILLPLVTQTSVDYLSSQTFAMRPRLWLKLISDNRATISSSPTFGYALCARRLRPSDYERYDLSSWRAACVGAEQINPVPLQQFAEALEPCGFDQKAFVACYGMAECVLAVSFAPLDLGLSVDYVDQDIMTNSGQAVPVGPGSGNVASYADCGLLLPGFDFSIRDDGNNELPERQCGELFLRGPSVMSGYFQDAESTRAVLSEDGWLDTGDIGYRVGEHLYITARSKDVIIIKGRNIWPVDMEVVTQRIDGVRLGGVAAFSVAESDAEEMAVMVVETRLRDEVKRNKLKQQISELIHVHFGINVIIDLVRSGSLPRTTSGKLSRFQSRHDYLERRDAEAARQELDDEILHRKIA
ncbi:MAG: fatty acyl-AMP ligase [Gammaproteobacteria bacterium]|nr:fatty acyl-AMP ligase [Gammaproteobacteria bacterium]